MPFVADESRFNCFSAYYSSIKEEPEIDLRPVHSMKSVARVHCASLVVFGDTDRIVSNDMQIEICKTLLDATPSFEWHCFFEGKYGFAAPTSHGFQPEPLHRARPLRYDFFRRRLLP